MIKTRILCFHLIGCISIIAGCTPPSSEVEASPRDSAVAASVQRLDLADPTLVAYWNFNEGSGTTLLDGSGEGNHGTVQNATWDPNGREGGCLYFNGTTSVVTVPDGAANTWNKGTPKTFNVWFRADGENDIRWILAHRDFSAGGYSLDELVIRTLDGSATRRNLRLPERTTWRPWTMATVVFTETELRFYRDGQLAATDPLIENGYPIQPGPLFFGARGASPTSERFRGWIDEVAFYSRALSNTEIAALYQENAESSDLVGEWSFDEMEGSTASDSSGNDNDGVILNATWDANGRWGGSLYFDGNSSVEIPHDASWNRGTPMTYIAWYRMDGATGGYVFEHEFGGTEPGGFALDRAELMSFRANVSATEQRSVTDPAGVSPGVWTMVAAVVAEDELRLYRDGELVNDIDTTGAVPAIAGSLFFGARGSEGDGYFRGWIDEVKLYKRALTEDELQTIYERYQGSDLVGHWRFDETSGTTAADQSGGDNDGVAQNVTWDPNGRVRGAAYFNGTNAVVTVPEGSWNQASPITLNIWYKIDEGCAGVSSVAHHVTGSGTFALDRPYVMRFHVGDDTAVGRSVRDPGSVPTGIWTMATMVATTTELRLYRDGQLITTTALEGGIPRRAGPLYFGSCRGTDCYFRGWIDDTKIWRRALSAVEIQALYADYAACHIGNCGHEEGPCTSVGGCDAGDVCDEDNTRLVSRDQQCAAGLVCGRANGDAFGMSSEVGVCWPPQCENKVDDPSESGVDCGGDCGTCSGVCPDHFCRLGEPVLPAPTEVLAFSDGLFERGSWATYQVGANRVEYAPADTLRFEDRGDGHGRVALFEGKRTNYLRQGSFISSPSWLPASSTADLPMSLSRGTEGPDGFAVAMLVADEAADGSPRQLVSGPPAAGSVSVWQRANPFAFATGTASRMHVATSTSSSALGGGSDWYLANEWQRYDTRVAATTGRAQVFFAHHEDFPTVGLHSLGAVEFEVWGFQWEDGTFPSSYIPTEHFTAARAADELTFPSASVPAWMRNGTWQIDVLPEFASTEMVGGRRYTLVSFGGDNDALYLLDGQLVLRTANTVRLNEALSWARHDKLTITVDSTNARVTIRTASGAQSAHAVSAFTFPNQPLRIGGSYGVINSEAFARISEPRRVNSASYACVPDEDYCSPECPCGETQGPCTSNAECAARLVCTPNAGSRYGLLASFGVCEHPSCSDPAAAASACGSTSSRCGLCVPGCTPDCSGKSCGTDGCGGSCGAQCGAGEGGAASAADCEAGLALGIAMGAQFDLPAHLNVCVDPICLSLRPEDVPCGAVTDTCGRCPVCVPHCDGRVCSDGSEGSDDGCGGSCGTCGAGTCTQAGHCIAAIAEIQHPPPAGTDLSTAPVGTLPGSFAVNHAGEATYTIPLAVPPGRGGIEPGLALTYNSSRDNGYLGLGWAVEGFSSIARCNRTVAVDGYAEAPQFLTSDALCLDGTRLIATTVEVTDSDIAVVFRLESDKFMLIRGYYSLAPGEVVGPMYFQARTKDGRILEFGGNENAVVYGVNRNDEPQVARWLLRSVSDRTNNTMHMLYAHRVNGMTSAHAYHGRQVEYYPKAITYGPEEKPLVINFVYDFDTGTLPKRVDGRSAWRDGTNIRIEHLLERVDVYVDDDVFRQYKLSYDRGTDRGEAYLLESVQQCDGADVCLPPTRFTYDDRIPAGAPVLDPLPNPVVPGGSIEDFVTPGFHYLSNSLETAPVDLNGDGIDDFLYSLETANDEERDDIKYELIALMSNGRVGDASHDYVRTSVVIKYIWRTAEPTSFGQYTTLSQNWVSSSPALGFFDYNNDGRTDVMFSTKYGDEAPRYRILSYDGNSFDYIDTGIDSKNGRHEVNAYVLDVNADGFKDLVRCGSNWSKAAPTSPASWHVFYNYQGTGFGNPLLLTPGLLTDAPCERGTVVLDANGDGREELLIKLHDTDPSPGASDEQSITGAAPASMLMFFEPDGGVSYLETNAAMGRKSDEGLPSLADFNGDGLLDILGWSTRQAALDRIYISVSLSRGDGTFFRVPDQALDFDFAGAVADGGNFLADYSGGAVNPLWLRARIVDVDRDGKQDLVGRFGGNDVYFSGGYIYNRAANLGLIDEEPSLPLHSARADYERDYDRDGWPELGFRMRGDRVNPEISAGFRVRGEGRPKLRNIIDGYGALVTANYGLLSDPAVHLPELYEPDGSPSCAYPSVCGLDKSSVVTSSEKEEGAVGRQHWDYQYGGARTGAEGRGFLGFSSRTIHEKALLEHVSTTLYSYDNRTRNDLRDFPFAFLPFSSTKYTYLPSSVYIESEHRTYVSTYPYRATVSDRVVGTHAPLATLTVREVFETSDSGPITLSHERDRVLEHDSISGNVTRREQTLSDDETRVLHTEYQHQSDDDFADAWLISQPRIHVDRYIYEGKQEVAKFYGFEYYANGKLRRLIDETDLVRTWEYNSHGGVTEEEHIGVTEGTRVHKVDWDDFDEYPTKITNAEDHETSLQYDRRFGQVAWTEDANDLLTTFGFDNFGRVKAVSRPDGSSVSFNYLTGDFTFPLVVEQLAGTGERILTAHDLGGRPTRRTTWDLTGKQLVETVGYDSRGRVHTSTLPTTPTAGAPLVVATNQYDNLDRPVLQQDTEGNTTRCYRGLVMCTEDGRGSTSCNVRDGRGRVVWVTKPVFQGCQAAMASLFSLDGVGYTYQAFDLLHQVTDNGQTTTITIDSSGRKIGSDDPDRGDESFKYTTFGELREHTNGHGEISSFYYDGLGRVIERRDWQGAVGGAYEASTWEWDGGATLDPGELYGALTRTESFDDVVRSYRYNALGQLEQETLAVDGDSFATTTTWDHFGRLSTVQYPARDGVSPFTLNYEYAPLTSGSGALKRVYNDSPDYAEEEYWTATETDLHGRLIEEDMGNGGSRSRSWYSSGRLETLTTRAAGGAAVQQMAYVYDEVGNLLSQEDALGQQSALYDYDALNRLRVELTIPARSYDYDEDGNLDMPGFEYNDPQPHALSFDGTFHYDYDGAGRRYLKRRADGSGQRVEYTRFDLPRAVHGLSAGGNIASTTEFSYDANGTRVRKQSAVEERTYTGGYEYRRFLDGRPAEQVFYVSNGSEVVAQVTALPGSTPSTAYLHNSRLGSAAAVEEGAVITRIRQDAFGVPLSVDGSSDAWSAPTNVGFTGHETDSELELINMSGRIYDPRARQFLTTDPIVSAPYLSLDLNPYAYAWGNPLRYVDPAGLQEASVADDSIATDDSPQNVVPLPPVIIPFPSQEPAFDPFGSPLSSEGFGGQVPYEVGSPLSPSQLGVQAATAEHDPIVELARGVNSGVNSTLASIGLEAVIQGISMGVGEWLSLAGTAIMPRIASLLRPAQQAGAGGGWQVIDEVAGGAIGQTTSVSCGAACGEMVSGIPQSTLIAAAGAPTGAKFLAQAMGTAWKAGQATTGHLPGLAAKGPFVAQLQEAGRMGHMVVVGGFDDVGQIIIHDPWAGGTTYKMAMSEFERVWTGIVIYK